jgi:glycosyltransferase involved in cell wall biosynthesis
MARAAVYVLSSLWEGLPNALIEALALGTPVIATDCHAGPREILDGGRYGLLVRPGEPRALAEQMLEVIRNPVALTPTPAYLHRFGVEACVDAYLQLLGARDA